MWMMVFAQDPLVPNPSIPPLPPQLFLTSLFTLSSSLLQFEIALLIVVVDRELRQEVRRGL